jgi:predicted adenylyl cyclase CyaB
MNAARNVELKARLRDLPAAREIAQRLATDSLGVQTQVDTYFVCPHGRMKVREINGRTAQLIWYERADRSTSKDSDYLLVEVSAARAKTLKAEMGIRGVVSKRREIFLHKNVRIHLDEVDRLGSFIEFEAVLSDKVSEPSGRRQVAELRNKFGIADDDLLAQSYSDMLLGWGEK